jgi:hypothetical protein
VLLLEAAAAVRLPTVEAIHVQSESVWSQSFVEKDLVVAHDVVAATSVILLHLSQSEKLKASHRTRAMLFY